MARSHVTFMLLCQSTTTNTTLELLHCFKIVKHATNIRNSTLCIVFHKYLLKIRKYHKNFFLPSVPSKKISFFFLISALVYKNWLNQTNRIMLNTS